MKIVFIGGRGIHILGGIENYMFNLTRELAKLGHECVVWCESDHREVEMLDGVKVIYHPGPKSNLLCKPWCGLKATVRTLLEEKEVSVIHYNAWPASLWCWIPRLFGIPSLMEGHGLEWQRSKYSPRAQKIMKLMEKFTARLNQHLIMCSEGQVKYFREEYGRESVCIPGAVYLPADNAGESSDILTRFSLEPKKFFLFMGRLVQDKNPDYLIKAFRRASLCGYKLVVAGGNDAMPEYVSYLHDLGKSCEEVVFTGPVYGEDKACLLRNAYCFCLPSTIEGLSIVMMEAASYKLPTIASDIDANREFLGDDAVYVQPENEDDLVQALEYACSHPIEMSQLVELNYKKLVEQYTWDKVAMKYQSYLKTIIRK
jgi:glycosyltransferase involved in cell wall biosynthesis